MKRSAVIVASMLMLPVLLFSQSAEETAIRKLLTDISTAVKAKDLTTLKKYWADDYTFITPAGLVQNKAEREVVIKNGPVMEYFAYEQPKIRMFNNVAVINTMAKVKNPGQAETTNPTTLVMVKTGENWKMVNGQGTRVAASSQGTGDAQQNVGSNAEQAIKAIEQEMLEALLKGDPSVNDKYMADTYIFTAPDGTIMNKARALADLKSGDLKMESSNMDDLKVTVYGNTAVASVLSTDKGKYKNTNLSGQYRWTDVFVNQHGRWQLVAAQGTQIMSANK